MAECAIRNSPNQVGREISQGKIVIEIIASIIQAMHDCIDLISLIEDFYSHLEPLNFLN